MALLLRDLAIYRRVDRRGYTWWQNRKLIENVTHSCEINEQNEEISQKLAYKFVYVSFFL